MAYQLIDPEGGIYPEFSWPHYFSRITGIPVINFGVAGASIRDYAQSTDRANWNVIEASGNKCQAYIVGLGINDIWRDEEPIGVISDIGTDNDTVYANYYKIITRLCTNFQNAVIFCNTIPKENDKYIWTNINDAIRDVVDYVRTTDGRTNVFLCDLVNYMTNDYYTNSVFSADYNGHYTPIGYNMMAQIYKVVLSDVVRSNWRYFRGVYLIPYDEVS